MGRIGLAFAAIAFAFLAAAPIANAEPKPVDLALVLAIDVSGSVNAERWELQRQGYERAFKSPEALRSITGGQRKAIAVTMVEWSGADHQKQVVNWMIINDPVSAEAFASAMAEAPRVYSDWTSISGGLDFALALLQNSDIDASRKVIDVSGDGVNNQGRDVSTARDEIVAKGIVINGLPILTEYDRLDEYYHDRVIGGTGSFIEVAKDYSSFAHAVQAKLVREIVHDDRRARQIMAGEMPATLQPPRLVSVHR